ncbi:MAG: hypothetical protein Q4D33_12410 [Prevotellaceae bacterium]|nr:hypothetical protein [Prevotellaceae bacterium]
MPRSTPSVATVALHTADTAIEQIKRKQYPAKIAEYTGDILLVGINYDKDKAAYVQDRKDSD